MIHIPERYSPDSFVYFPALHFSGKYQEDYRGGYSGYGYRSYSFPGGGKVLSGTYGL